MRLIWPTSEAEYFCAKGWMTQISLIRLGKLAFWRSALSTVIASEAKQSIPQRGDRWIASLRSQ
jgi:hypothetical protein